jgi:hypothetical protein
VIVILFVNLSKDCLFPLRHWEFLRERKELSVVEAKLPPFLLHSKPLLPAKVGFCCHAVMSRFFYPERLLGDFTVSAGCGLSRPFFPISCVDLPPLGSSFDADFRAYLQPNNRAGGSLDPDQGLDISTSFEYLALVWVQFSRTGLLGPYVIYHLQIGLAPCWSP